MKKNYIIALLSAAVVILAIVVVVMSQDNSKPETSSINSTTTTSKPTTESTTESTTKYTIENTTKKVTTIKVPTTKHTIENTTKKVTTTKVPSTKHTIENTTKKVTTTKVPTTFFETTTRKPSQTNKIYKVGETWTVDGYWEFTVNSVTKHYFCSTGDNYDDVENSCEECIMITYSYKNLGYENKVNFSAMNIDVYDETGEAAEIYEIFGCDHCKDNKLLDVGMKCTNAQTTFALHNTSDTVTIVVDFFNTDPKFKATFVVPVT